MYFPSSSSQKTSSVGAMREYGNDAFSPTKRACKPTRLHADAKNLYQVLQRMMD
jgi:hypothetical protein